MTDPNDTSADIVDRLNAGYRFPPMPAAKLQLHEYQRQAVQFLQDRRKAALFLDMGLGKTAICLTALNADSLPALVTAPKRVAENVWETEAALWRPDLRVVVAKGTPKTREAALASGADIVVIGRDNLADAVPQAHRFKTLIMDELSGWKSRASIRWKAAKKITQAPSVTHVWGLTGTPIPNGLLDMWPQVFLLDGGLRLGTTLGGYRNRYFSPGRQLPNGVVTEWNLRPGADKRIHALLDDLCLSMGTEGKVDLPPTTFNTIHVPLPPKVRQIYKAMKNDLVADMTVLGGEIHSAVNAAVLTSKLAQICAGFMYVDDADIRDRAYDVLHKEKAKVVGEIVEGTGSQEDVLYELLLKAGFPLTTKIETVRMAETQAFSIQEGALLVCLEKEITSELIDALAEANPLQVICLDEGFKGNDQLKANAVQTFKARAQAEESEIVFKTV